MAGANDAQQPRSNPPGMTPTPGDHVYVRRAGYIHHGIVGRSGEVIHFAGGSGELKVGAVICRCSLAEFASGSRVCVRSYGKRDAIEVIVERAESSLGEGGYHLVNNNCEHFATWCSTGRRRSRQVSTVKSTSAVGVVQGVGVATTVGAVTTAGVVGGVSGPGIMSGLAAAGFGGAVGGIISLGLVPGAASVLTMQVALRDDECLPDEDRAARSDGRKASVAGVAAGSGGAFVAVGAAGVSGLSAAGITSGLAAIGGVVGGGMLAGTVVLVAAPAAAAVGAGYGGYRASRWLRRRSTGRSPSNGEAHIDESPSDG
ncbi:lecithin retinol acyltransferase family protein [Aquihabitans sp. McL0605]|uniref:lecithin retinol acyltransferase family protein n=1 Tax=Aquihabitans sp. McL0605 TaxID=3415671 RepID=UPI003CE7EBCE